MQISELRIKAKKELLSMLQDLQKELLSLRFDLATQKLKDTSRIRKTRKDVAKIKTVLKEKELLGEPKNQKTKKPRNQETEK